MGEFNIKRLLCCKARILKVMFLHMSVILFTGGRAWQGMGAMHGRGVCVAGGMHGRRGTYMAGEMATAAGGMHPTGMHSCILTHIILLEECVNTVCLCFSHECSQFSQSFFSGKKCVQDKIFGIFYVLIDENLQICTDFSLISMK